MSSKWGISHFAYKWFKRFKKVEGHAYEGKTDYSCINVKGGKKGLSYYWDKFMGNLEDKEYPTASLNYPTGKNIVRYAAGKPYVYYFDRPFYEYNNLYHKYPIMC